MKTIVFGLILAFCLSVSGLAQKQKTSPDAESDSKPIKPSSNKSAPSGTILLESGAAIEAQLTQTLDVRKASVGDEVVLRTAKAIKRNGEIVVQKGARLVGRVTEVQQKTKDNAQSRLGVIFERIEGKNLSAPISARIVSITQANVNAALGDTSETDVSGSSQSSGNVSTGGAGGGLLGGVTNTVGSVVNTTTGTVGNVTNTAGRTVSGTTAKLGQTLKDVRLSQSSSASVNGSTTLSTSGKNLRIEKGMTFQLQLNESIEN